MTATKRLVRQARAILLWWPSLASRACAVQIESAADKLPRAEIVLILDFGSQYAQLIARRVREQYVFCQIVRHDISTVRVRELAPKGLILSGGPASVYGAGAPRCDPEIFRLGIPILA